MHSVWDSVAQRCCQDQFDERHEIVRDKPGEEVYGRAYRTEWVVSQNLWIPRRKGRTCRRCSGSNGRGGGDRHGRIGFIKRLAVVST